MLLTMMKAKLHRATVTQADLEYEGSIAIDRDLLDASGIFAHEEVDVLKITTGAAARLVRAGDKVIVVTYCQMDAAEARNYAPVVVLLDDGNAIKKAA